MTQNSIRLTRLRRHLWMAIALCLFARITDAALGLHLIDQSPSVAAQEGPSALLVPAPQSAASISLQAQSSIQKSVSTGKTQS